MFTSIRKAIRAVVALGLPIVLAGCGPSTTTYVIKAYSGGAAVATFEASSYGSGEGRVYANMVNGRKHAVGCTFSVRHTDASAANNTACPAASTAALARRGEAAVFRRIAHLKRSGLAG